ncbi:Crp/Fnr family transcriptional regulator [Azospirillum sp.]|uniref:Crp/Fnr family transcriptional regulator n=1 Tax=Azospirillum sp. TaxID=34012 RepID=UPI002D5C3A68|nr:Crp/Fnr family transcriptional regulator [Azospirillum sp.]HYD69884.1 Crp/Fnr family transcriptional regulator [Azospirillum sp.]
MLDRSAQTMAGLVETETGSGLAVCPVLADLPAEAIASLETASRWLKVPAETMVVRHDDPSDAVYFIVSGAVRVFFRTREQHEVSFAQIGPGGVFGELAAIDGLGRSADVVTVEDSVLAACPREAFVEALQRYPKLTFGILVKFANIIRQSDRQVMRFASLSATQRVYLEMLRLAVPDVSGDGTWVLSPAPLHKDIASWAGTTPDVVGRAIGNLMRGGILRRQGGDLQVMDRTRLETLAHMENPPEETGAAD